MDHTNGSTPPNSGNGNLEHQQHQLDLTNNREYRGSAFELYKKPMHNSPHQQYQNSVW